MMNKALLQKPFYYSCQCFKILRYTEREYLLAIAQRICQIVYVRYYNNPTGMKITIVCNHKAPKISVDKEDHNQMHKTVTAVLTGDFNYSQSLKSTLH